MVVSCRQHVAWSTATFADGILSAFIIPFGPLLILSYLNSSATTARTATTPGDAIAAAIQGNPGDGEQHFVGVAVTQWATVASLWSKVFAGFLAGRTAGKIVGPSIASNFLGVSAFVTVCLAGAVLTQLWLGLDVSSTGDTMFWARMLGGLFSGVLCGGSLSLSGPCPRSSPCARCHGNAHGISGGGTLSRSSSLSQHISEIYFSKSLDSGVGGDNSLRPNGSDGLRTADGWWHAGTLSGLAAGGLFYGRSFGWRWLNDKPGLLACAAACSCVGLLVAFLGSSPSSQKVKGGHGVKGGFRIPFGGRKSSDDGSGAARSRQGEGSGRHQKEEYDEAEAPLLGDVFVHNPGISNASEAGSRDLEAGVSERVSTDGVVSARYVKACKGDAAAAREMWNATIKWRADTGAEHSLSTPQPTLEIIKDCYPYFAHGRSKAGEVVVYERTGRMQFGRLSEAGVSPLDMQMHYAFFNDFVFGKLLTADDAQLMTVLDVGELRLATLKNNTVVTKYLAATAEVMQKHYPERQSRILVVNAPWWFAGIWKTVSGMLASGTQAKLQIRGANFLPTLLEHVDASQVPQEYGGNSPHKLGFSPEEEALKQLASSLGPTKLDDTTAAHKIAGDGAETTPPRLDAANGPDPPSIASVATAAVTAQSEALIGPIDGSSARANSATGEPRLQDIDIRGTAADGNASGATAATSPGNTGGRVKRFARDSSVVSSSSGTGVSGTGGDRNPAAVSSGDAAAAAAAAAVAAPIAGGGSGGGMTKRLVSAVRRIRGSATQAYLGVENKFRYDTQQRMWIIDGEKEGGGRRRGGGVKRSSANGAHDEEEGNGRANDSDREGSEQNLIRAIQAAQQVREGGAIPSSSTFFNKHDFGGGGSAGFTRTLRMDGPPPVAGEGESAAVVILGLNLAWVALEAGMEAIIPLWLLVPAGRGGMNFSAFYAGVALVIAMASLALPRYMARSSLLRSLARTPIRTLRTSAVVLTLVYAGLSALAKTSRFPTYEANSRALLAVAVSLACVRVFTIMARPALTSILSVALGHATAGEDNSMNDGYYRRRTGSRTLLSLARGVSQIVGVLGAGLIFAKAVKAVGAGAGMVCFRLAAVAYAGVLLATLLLHATGSAGGGVGAGEGGRLGAWRGADGLWLPTCDLVEQARSGSLSARSHAGGFGGEGGRGSEGGAGAAALAKES